MGFYESFIDKYDILVSWENREQREREFWKSLFETNNTKTVLDCACGTGQHVVMFNQLGYPTKGSDLSKQMVDKAILNTMRHGIEAKFKILSFLELSEHYNETFDSIICMGNSLPHLESEEKLIVSLKEMYKVLNDDGLFVVGMRNYDYLLSERPKIIPMTYRESDGFIYVLDYFEKKIVFNIVHMDLLNKECSTFSVDYFPIRSAQLINHLEETGFKEINCYSDYKYGAFENDKSDNLIVVCKK